MTHLTLQCLQNSAGIVHCALLDNFCIFRTTHIISSCIVLITVRTTTMTCRQGLMENFDVTLSGVLLDVYVASK